MTKVHLLGANRSYDRSVQTVSVNQVVVLEGYSHDSYVVYEVSRNGWGITYHLTHLAASDHLHHLAGLVKLFQQAVYFLNIRTATFGNALAA